MDLEESHCWDFKQCNMFSVASSTQVKKLMWYFYLSLSSLQFCLFICTFHKMLEYLLHQRFKCFAHIQNVSCMCYVCLKAEVYTELGLLSMTWWEWVWNLHLLRTRGNRRARTHTPQTPPPVRAASHTEKEKNTLQEPWGKASIRILPYHKSQSWIIHTWQLQSSRIHSRMWAWQRFFEVWICLPSAQGTS